MKKRFILILCVTLITFGVFGTTGNVFADSLNDIKKVDIKKINLSEKQQRQIDDTVKESERFIQIINNNDLSKEDVERLFRVSNHTPYTTANIDEKDDIVFINGQEDVKLFNEQLQSVGEDLLPKDTVSVTLQKDNSFVAKTKTGEYIVQPRGFWGKAWQVTKCAAHLTLLIVPGTLAFKAIKALGGIRATAALLVGAGSAEEFLSIAGGAASVILGIDGLYENCFVWS